MLRVQDESLSGPTKRNIAFVCGGSASARSTSERRLALGGEIHARANSSNENSAGFSRVGSVVLLVFELFQSSDLNPCKLGLQGFDPARFPE